jgi:hypothetical protein
MHMMSKLLEKDKAVMNWSTRSSSIAIHSSASPAPSSFQWRTAKPLPLSFLVICADCSGSCIKKQSWWFSWLLQWIEWHSSLKSLSLARFVF